MSAHRSSEPSGDVRNAFESLRRLLQKINYRREFDIEAYVMCLLCSKHADIFKLLHYFILLLFVLIAIPATERMICAKPL